MKKDGQRVEFLDACGLDDAHQHLMVGDAIVRAVAKSDFAHDDVIAEHSLGDVVVRADPRNFQTGDKLKPLGGEFHDEFVCMWMIQLGLQRTA